MELDQIWNNFTKRMSEIHLFYDSAKELTEKELNALNDLSNNLNVVNSIGEWSQYRNFVFTNAITGDLESYNQTNRSFEEFQIHFLLHKNKQYQWLLAEAYEEFEDYLESVYGYYGYKNNSFWLMSDYGNISLGEVSIKEYGWYVAQTRKKRNIPSSILSKFRKEFPELNKIEKENSFNFNLALAITLIEKLRHLIVHNGGKTESKDDFVNKVIQEAGLENNKNPDPKYINFINTFWGKNEYENQITLLEISVLPEIPLKFEASRCLELINFLISYAFLIYQEIKSRPID